MNPQSRLRRIQIGLGVGLIVFLVGLAGMLLYRARPGSGRDPLPPIVTEIEEGQNATQISTGFRVTRTREGTAEFQVQASRLLGLEEGVYLLEEPVIEIHHEDQGITEVTGQEGSFDIEAGEGLVQGEAKAITSSGLVLQSDKIEYLGEGSAIVAEGGAHFEREGLRGRANSLRYDPASETMTLEGEVHIEGEGAAMNAQSVELGRWTLETEWLEYPTTTRRMRTTAFVLASKEGALSGGELNLLLREDSDELELLIAERNALLRVPMEGAGLVASRVIAGDRIEMEPSRDKSGEPRRLLAEGEARLFREGGPTGEVQELEAHQIEWTRDEEAARRDPDDEVSRRGHVEARGSVLVRLGAADDPSTLTASQMEGRMDDSGRIEWGRAVGDVRYRGPEGRATGEQGEFHADGDRLVLRGAPANLEGPEGTLSARVIDLAREKGVVNARGDVRTVTTRTPAGDALFESGRPIHGTSDSLRALRKQARVIYQGAARLWQDENLLQADRIDVRQGSRELHAAGRVVTRSLLAEEESGDRQRLVVGKADTLDYYDKEGRATYDGGARLEWGTDRVEAETIDVFAGEGRDLRRVMARGGVRLTGEGREARGEELDYDVDGDRAVLHGGDGLAMAQDAQNQQVVRGRTLTFTLSDGRISVDSGPGGRTWIILSPSEDPPRSPGEEEEDDEVGKQSVGPAPGH